MTEIGSILPQMGNLAVITGQLELTLNFHYKTKYMILTGELGLCGQKTIVCNRKQADATKCLEKSSN